MHRDQGASWTDQRQHVSWYEQQVRWCAEHLPRQTHVRPEPRKRDDAILGVRPGQPCVAGSDVLGARLTVIQADRMAVAQ